MVVFDILSFMKYTIFLIATLLIVGCSSKQDTLLRKHIFNQELHLLTMEANTRVPKGVTILIKSDGSFKGFGGCNNYRGRYTINKDYIYFKLEDIDTKVCDNTYFEHLYYGKLVNTNQIIIQGKKVYFHNKESRLLEFTH